MVDKTPKHAVNGKLRARAEQLLSALVASENTNITDIKSLIHELQIHQVELEVQNEELKQTQLTPANARDQYRELYDHAPVAYLNLDQQGVILEANIKTADLLASQRNNLPGSALAEYITADSQDAWYLHLQAVFASESKQTVELTINKEPRTVVLAESICKVFVGRESVQSHTVLLDITLQKMAAETLAEANQVLTRKVSERARELHIRREERAALLNTATDAIFTINERGVIETANRAAGPMFGYANTDLIGSQISLLMPEPHASAHNHYISRYLETGKSRILGRATEMLGRRKDNTLFPVSLSVNRIDDELKFIGIIRDMTERVKLEEEVLQGIEVERNRISRELHDNIGQLLVGIAMKASALSAAMEKAGNNRCAALLSEISTSLELAGQEVSGIVKDLAALQLQDNSLEDYFKDLVDASNSFSTAEIILDWQDGLQIRDQHAGTQLFRIAQEALHNAIKHADATQILLTMEQSAGKTILTIADNGVGLTAANLNKSNAEPTGLGLSNMKYRAHIISATLETASDDHGTTVRCVMPV